MNYGQTWFDFSYGPGGFTGVISDRHTGSRLFPRSPLNGILTYTFIGSPETYRDTRDTKLYRFEDGNIKNYNVLDFAKNGFGNPIELDGGLGYFTGATNDTVTMSSQPTAYFMMYLVLLSQILINFLEQRTWNGSKHS
jgi:hypothetical protein